jgi:transposase InsO family protein
MLGVSSSGFYAWKGRPASARALRHLWLAGEITDVHRESGGIYGERRVAAELRHGRGIVVSRKTVTLLMRRLGLYGLPKRRLPKGAKVGKYAASDLVRREFTVTAPNRLWTGDITEHPTREGKVLLLRRPRCVLPQGRRLAGRHPTEHAARHERLDDGHARAQPGQQSS